MGWFTLLLPDHIASSDSMYLFENRLDTFGIIRISSLMGMATFLELEVVVKSS